jgi:hypothetical protein
MKDVTFSIDGHAQLKNYIPKQESFRILILHVCSTFCIKSFFMVISLHNDRGSIGN